METKKKFLEKIHGSELYVKSMEKLPEHERTSLRATTDPMFGELFEMIEGLRLAIDQNPEVRAELERVLQGEQVLVNNESKHSTGSLG